MKCADCIHATNFRKDDKQGSDSIIIDCYRNGNFEGWNHADSEWKCRNFKERKLDFPDPMGL